MRSFNAAIGLIVLLSAFWAGNVYAQDKVVFVPQLGVAVQNYELGIGGSADFEGVDVSGNLPTVTGAFGAQWKGIFSSIRLDYASGDTEPNIADVDIDTERSDFAFTVGYKVWRNLSVFGGYLYGQTELDVPDANTFIIEFEEQGPYIGVGYGWGIGNAGTLSVSGAYALLDAEYTEIETGFEDLVLDADANGFSFSLSWSGPIVNSLSYYVDARYRRYDINYDLSGIPDDTETMASIGAGLRWPF